jgi:hypothetical protein
VTVTDAAARTATDTCTVTARSLGDDFVPPVISNVSPPSAGDLSSDSIIQLDVTDTSGMTRRIQINAYIANTAPTSWPPAPGQEPEMTVVHDGDCFGASYAAGSSRTAIPNGYRYRIVRGGGWPTSGTGQVYVIFRAAAIDCAGNENQGA